MRALMRRKYPLPKACLMHGFHFFEPLQRRRFGTSDKAFITGRGEIAFGQAAIIMGWSNQPVKISFACNHLSPVSYTHLTLPTKA